MLVNVEEEAAVRESRGEKVFNVFNIMFMIAFMLAIVLPLLYIVVNSFVSPEESARRSVIILPEKFDLTAYKLMIFGSSDIVTGYTVTLYRTIVGTFLNMLFSSFVAYTLSRKDLPYRSTITMYLFITMLFSGGLIPYFIVARATGMQNNLLVYIVPGLISVWNVLLLRNFMMEIPESINESAEIDGANQVYILFKLIIPLSVPSLVTVALFYAVGHWNSWFDAYLFMTDNKKYPMQLILRNILITSQLHLTGGQASSQIEDIIANGMPTERSVRNAAVIVSTLPIVCVYPFIQKYFVKGVMVGSIKG